MTRLVHVDDQRLPGIRRERLDDADNTFRYFDAQGRRVTAEAELQRINRLAIPPAYTDVWICPLPNGHLQATGRDARGRKQYRYHAHWRAARDEDKFARLLEFGRVLPGIRRRVAADLAAAKKSGAPQRRAVLAAVVRAARASAAAERDRAAARGRGEPAQHGRGVPQVVPAPKNPAALRERSRPAADCTEALLRAVGGGARAAAVAARRRRAQSAHPAHSCRRRAQVGFAVTSRPPRWAAARCPRRKP